MAAARDQSARILRREPEVAESGSTRDTSAAPAEVAPSHPAGETIARRGAEAPHGPAIDQPGAAPAAASVAPKSGKRKLVLMAIVALLALAAASYGVHYVLVGRFHVSTD